jgi:bacterioferritin (cytochrome b1)
VANAITKLGGKPSWAFEPLPARIDHLKIFRIQLEREKLALQSHRQSASMVLETTLKDNFNKIAKEKEQHIKAVEQIISRLS